MSLVDQNPQSWLKHHKVLALAIPMLGGLLAFVPLFFAGQLLAMEFGIDIDAPLMSQTHSLLFLNLFVVLMAVFVICGFLVGLAIVVRLVMSRFCLTWREAWREFKEEGWAKR